MTDIMMVPPVLMTWLISATLKTEKTDRTLNGKASEKNLEPVWGRPVEGLQAFKDQPEKWKRFRTANS